MTTSCSRTACCSPLVWGLLLSVGLNLFLVGILSASFLGGDHGFGPPHGRGPHGPPSPEMMLERMASRLPEADANKLRTIFKDQSDDLEKTHTQMTASFDALKDILSSEKPDMDKLHECLKTLGAADDSFHAHMGAMIEQVAIQLPLESRLKIVDLIGPPRGGPDDGHDNRRDDFDDSEMNERGK